MSKEIRDLDVSQQEGEDVKGGAPAPMPIAKNPGTATGTTSKDRRPITSTAAAPVAKKTMPPVRVPPKAG